MDTKPPTKVVTTHLPIELADKLDAYATRLDRSRAWIVKQALANWVDKEDERHQGTLEALAQGDAGLTIDHEDVMAWWESLDTSNPLPMPQAKAES